MTNRREKLSAHWAIAWCCSVAVILCLACNSGTNAVPRESDAGTPATIILNLNNDTPCGNKQQVESNIQIKSACQLVLDSNFTTKFPQPLSYNQAMQVYTAAFQWAALTQDAGEQSSKLAPLDSQCQQMVGMSCFVLLYSDGAK